MSCSGDKKGLGVKQNAVRVNWWFKFSFRNNVKTDFGVTHRHSFRCLNLMLPVRDAICGQLLWSKMIMLLRN